MWVDSCTSTNDLAKELAQKGCSHGAWIAARTQTHGRGRSGSWISQPGNLHLSVILKNQPWYSLTRIPLEVGCVVINTLISFIPPNHRRTVLDHLKLKWPNDLYWVAEASTPRKLGGILCESQGSGQNSATAIVGIGINLLHIPKGIFNPEPISWLSLFPEISPPDLDFLASTLADQIALRFQNSDGTTQPTNWRGDFLQHSWIQPRVEVEWNDCQGVMRELGDHGELVVEITQPAHQRGQIMKLMNETIRVIKK